MRERRLKEGNNTLFDWKSLFIEKNEQRGKRLLKMKRGPISYMTQDGIRFWSAHPFQWVTKGEAEWLTGLESPEFVLATIEDVEDYYIL